MQLRFSDIHPTAGSQTERIPSEYLQRRAGAMLESRQIWEKVRDPNFRCKLCEVCKGHPTPHPEESTSRISDRPSQLQNASLMSKSDFKSASDLYLSKPNAWRFNFDLREELKKSNSGTDAQALAPKPVLPRNITLANPYGSSSINMKSFLEPVKSEYRESFYNPRDARSKSSIREPTASESLRLSNSRLQQDEAARIDQGISQLEALNIRERYLLPINNLGASKLRYPLLTFKTYGSIPAEVKRNPRFYILQREDRLFYVYDIGVETAKPDLNSLRSSGTPMPADLSKRYY